MTLTPEQFNKWLKENEENIKNIIIEQVPDNERLQNLLLDTFKNINFVNKIFEVTNDLLHVIKQEGLDVYYANYIGSLPLRYVKNPVEITAIKYNKINDSYKYIEDFGGEEYRNKIIVDPENGDLFIETLEGRMKINDGDYVIKGIKGELYPCKPDIFEASYTAI